MKVILKTVKNGVVSDAKLFNSKTEAERAGKKFLNKVTMINKVKEGRSYRVVKA